MKKLSLDASEGDVETQIVLPLVTKNEYLGIPVEEIRSKNGLAARDIGKGNKRKIGYVPDYCVFKKSLPILGCGLIKPEPQSHSGEFCESQIG
jgi:hypothetical protein